jgi:hypothetical protein
LFSLTAQNGLPYHFIAFKNMPSAILALSELNRTTIDGVEAFLTFAYPPNGTRASPHKIGYTHPPAIKAEAPTKGAVSAT